MKAKGYATKREITVVPRARSMEYQHTLRNTGEMISRYPSREKFHATAVTGSRSRRLNTTTKTKGTTTNMVIHSMVEPTAKFLNRLLTMVRAGLPSHRASLCEPAGLPGR
ncbi:MAG: hypothetical protein BWX71_02225 [Deltaproteobacteria bacterium ADurb.Bin072]|nr:MAG: hypothetical protein BWX71_02225 [Deltaproteobacteria bacterium ADurb.Bin072]